MFGFVYVGLALLANDWNLYGWIYDAYQNDTPLNEAFLNENIKSIHKLKESLNVAK